MAWIVPHWTGLVPSGLGRTRCGPDWDWRGLEWDWCGLDWSPLVWAGPLRFGTDQVWSGLGLERPGVGLVWPGLELRWPGRELAQSGLVGRTVGALVEKASIHRAPGSFHP